HSHHFQHYCPTMLQALPWTERALYTRVDVVDVVGREDFIRCIFSPRYQLIEKVIGWLPSVCDALFCCNEGHTSSDGSGRSISQVFCNDPTNVRYASEPLAQFGSPWNGVSTT